MLETNLEPVPSKSTQYRTGDTNDTGLATVPREHATNLKTPAKKRLNLSCSHLMLEITLHQPGFISVTEAQTM